jgi:hypothetical protein
VLAEPYVHFLFYNRHEETEQANTTLARVFDLEGSICALEGCFGYEYAIAFNTQDEFQCEQIEHLLSVTNPDAYNFNNEEED